MSFNLATQQIQNSPHEEIALRAHRLWEERGCPIGSPAADWYRAAEQIHGEQAARDELIRARNKSVREHRAAPEIEGAPAFSDHSGEL
ncbi:MAG TPA: DUF2934 domain-containing protein [Terriglobia bacterium]|nr:DUF2934 domain-containing protein [Terriglobia bacterium]